MTAVAPRNGNNPIRPAAPQAERPTHEQAQQTARKAGVPEAFIPATRALRLSAERLKPAAATDRAFTVAETDERYAGVDANLKTMLKLVSNDGVVSPAEAKALLLIRADAIKRAEADGVKDANRLYGGEMMMRALTAYASAQGHNNLVASGLGAVHPELVRSVQAVEARQAEATPHVVTAPAPRNVTRPAVAPAETTTDQPTTSPAQPEERPALPFDPEAIAGKSGMICENGVCRPIAPDQTPVIGRKDPEPIAPQQPNARRTGPQSQATQQPRHPGPTGATDPRFTQNVIEYSRQNPGQDVYVYVWGKKCGNCRHINKDALRSTAQANGGAFFDVDAQSTSIGKLYRPRLTMPVVFKIRNGQVVAEKNHLSPTDLAGRGANRMFRPGTLQSYRRPLNLAAGERMTQHNTTPQQRVPTMTPRGVSVRGRSSCRSGRCGVGRSRPQTRRRRGGCGSGCGGGGCRSGSCGVSRNRRQSRCSAGHRGHQRQVSRCHARRRTRRCGGFNPFRAIGRLFR